ncbi:MAG: hypothetical protein IJA15_06250 [Clostridia bacterium]|nr:hypothetical protein [Clostridia bacterium]
MKKLILLTLTFIMVLLTGCEPPSFYFLKTNYLDDIESIELVKYNNSNFEMVDPSKTVLTFDYKKVEKLETLDSNKIEEFLDDFEEIIFFHGNKSVNEPTGYCLLWHFKDGTFMVFSCTIIPGDRGYDMVATFDSTGKFLSHGGYFAAEPHYVLVLSKYFSSYIIE